MSFWLTDQGELIPQDEPTNGEAIIYTKDFDQLSSSQVKELLSKGVTKAKIYTQKFGGYLPVSDDFQDLDDLMSFSKWVPLIIAMLIFMVVFSILYYELIL